MKMIYLLEFKKTICLGTLLYLSPLTGVISTAYGLGPGGSGGGNGIIINNQVYLMEFVESGVQAHPDMDFGRVEKPNFESNERQQLVVLKFSDHEEYRTVNDNRSYDLLRHFLSRSTLENGFMFGEEKNVTDCKKRTLKCLSPEAEIAIALTNRLSTSLNYPAPYADKTVTLFLDKFLHLNWLKIDVPLKDIEDTTSAIDKKNRFLLARRDSENISIFSGSWSKGFRQGSQKIAPLNLVNRIGLITHEVFYALTSQQGDLDSDRARKINTEFWNSNSTQDQYKNSLSLIPGHPAKTLAEAYLLSELPLDQELEVTSPFKFEVPDIFVITKDAGLMPFRTWFGKLKYPDKSAYVEIYNLNNSFAIDTNFNKNLRLKIDRIETQIMSDWYRTVIYFKHPGNFSYEIDRMYVAASDGGKYPITVTEFEETISGYFMLRKVH